MAALSSPSGHSAIAPISMAFNSSTAPPPVGIADLTDDAILYFMYGVYPTLNREQAEEIAPMLPPDVRLHGFETARHCAYMPTTANKLLLPSARGPLQHQILTIFRYARLLKFRNDRPSVAILALPWRGILLVVTAHTARSLHTGVLHASLATLVISNEEVPGPIKRINVGADDRFAPYASFDHEADSIHPRFSGFLPVSFRSVVSTLNLPPYMSQYRVMRQNLTPTHLLALQSRPLVNDDFYHDIQRPDPQKTPATLPSTPPPFDALEHSAHVALPAPASSAAIPNGPTRSNSVSQVLEGKTSPPSKTNDASAPAGHYEPAPSANGLANGHPSSDEGPNSGPAPSATASDAETATVSPTPSVPPTTAAAWLSASPYGSSSARTSVELGSHAHMPRFLFPAESALAASRFPSFSASLAPYGPRPSVREGVSARDALMARTTVSRNSTSLRVPLANAGTVGRSGVAGRLSAVSRLVEPPLSPNGLHPDVGVRIAHAFFRAPLYETDGKGGFTCVVKSKIPRDPADLEFRFESQITEPKLNIKPRNFGRCRRKPYLQSRNKNAYLRVVEDIRLYRGVRRWFLSRLITGDIHVNASSPADAFIPPSVRRVEEGGLKLLEALPAEYFTDIGGELFSVGTSVYFRSHKYDDVRSVVEVRRTGDVILGGPVLEGPNNVEENAVAVYWCLDGLRVGERAGEDLR